MKKVLTLIIHEARRMSEMVSDILDYSQFKAGYMKLKKENPPAALAGGGTLYPAAGGGQAGGVVPTLHFFSLLGISYMTFRSVQVLLDIFDGGLTELQPLELSYFLLFFPSVASGPIDRYRRFLEDLHRKHDHAAYLAQLGRGIWKLLFGVFSDIVLSGLIQNLWLFSLPQQGFGATVS